jgi:hypothetical protein
VDGASLFVVRVWRADGFRASVRRVDDEDTRWFKSAADVATYLEMSCKEEKRPGRAGAPPPASGNGEET